MTRASQMLLQPARNSIPSRNCPKRRSYFSWEADTATQRNFPTWPGTCSGKLHRVGAGSRQFVISFTTISHLAMSMPALQELPGKRSTSEGASAVILHILLLHSVGA